MKKIALFGTSADPPTRGHQAILSWLSKHYDLVVVWASDNPFKKHQTDLINRSQMLSLAIGEIDSITENITLIPELSDRRSLITIQKARKIWQDAEFTFVIGSDLISQISSWYHIEELLSQVKILIIPRAGYIINQSELDILENLGSNFTIAQLQAPEASSTAYRLQQDQTVLTPLVLSYIKQKNLYQNNLSNKFVESNLSANTD